jgi:tetratricopeptide (TPR) repeat protein
MFCKRTVARLPSLSQQVACFSQRTTRLPQRSFISQNGSAFRKDRPLLRADPQFTTNPYTQSVLEVSRQARQVGKAIGIFAVSTTTIVFIGWQGYHIYIEHFLHPTPPELKHKARNLLHGAYVREEVQPQLEIATLYVEEALRIALEEQKMEEDSDVALALRRRLAEDLNRAGNLLDSITEYSRFWKLLIKRLVDTGEDNNANKVFELVEVSKKIGDLYIRIGDYSEAEESLAWAVHTLKTSKADLSTEKDFQKLETLTTLSLANLYAVQRNFDLALPLYLQSLKASNQAAQQQPEAFICLTAIIQCQLSETLFGMGRKDEALGWAQTALETAKTGISEDNGGSAAANVELFKDCEECAGVTLNNIGKMLEV